MRLFADHLPRLGEIDREIARYHASLTELEFERQRESRRTWEEWLSPFGFFRQLNRVRFFPMLSL